MNENIKAILSVAKSELLNSSLFLSGFELEFQRCNGRTVDDDEGGDESAAIEDFMQLLREGEEKIKPNWVPYRDWVDADSTEFLDNMGHQTVSQLRALLSGIKDAALTTEEHRVFVRETLPKALDTIESKITEMDFEDLNVNIWDVRDPSDFPMNGRDLLTHSIRNIEIKTDSSVEGGEIIVDSPTTPAKCLDIANRLFTENSWRIDTGCSFHIHLSVPGVTHVYGRQFQLELYLYLLSQWERVPAAVKARWTNLHYCRLHLSKDKYSFVHYHQEYRTWEFRCFGNVSTTEDATACYQLALEAMHHAYQVRAGEHPGLLSRFAEPENLLNRLTEDLARSNFTTETFWSLVSSVAIAS